MVRSVVLNVAKAIAIVCALFVLRSIIGAIGRGVAAESAGSMVSVLVTTSGAEKAEIIG